MAAPAPTFIGLWDTSRPGGTESRTLADDYHRNFAQTVQNSFPNVNGIVNASNQDLDTLWGYAGQGTHPLPGVRSQTILYFYLATVPPGYVPANPDANVRTLMVGGTGGQILGSDDPRSLAVNTTVTVNLPAATAAHTLDITQIPAHDHELSRKGSLLRGLVGGGGENTWVGDVSIQSGSAGGGLGHSHGIGGTATGSGTDTLTPRYAMGILGRFFS